MIVDLAAEIRFRCPHCQKLFCTDNTAFSDLNSSEFSCTECQKDFMLFKDLLSTGLYLTQPVQKPSFSLCPKCSTLKPIGKDECPHCGVYESKFVSIQKVENPRLYELSKTWEVVLQDMTKDESHQKFLDQAQKQSALNFAAQKYNDLKKIIGHDPMIEKYLKQIEQRLEAHIQAQLLKARGPEVEENKSMVASGRFFIFVAFLGTIILLLNKVKPMFPNLTGLVIAVTVLSYGLWFMTRTSSAKRKKI